MGVDVPLPLAAVSALSFGRVALGLLWRVGLATAKTQWVSEAKPCVWKMEMDSHGGLKVTIRQTE